MIRTYILRRTRRRLPIAGNRPKPPGKDAVPRAHRWRWVGCWAAMIVVCALLATPAHAANGSVTYTYDALGRVTSMSYDTGVIVIYTYDPNGNRLSQVINVNTASLTWTATPSPPAACTSNCWGGALW